MLKDVRYNYEMFDLKDAEIKDEEIKDEKGGIILQNRK